MRKHVLWALLFLSFALGQGIGQVVLRTDGNNPVAIHLDYNNNTINNSDKAINPVSRVDGNGIGSSYLSGKSQESANRQRGRPKYLTNRHYRPGIDYVPPKMPVLIQGRVNIWKVPIHGKNQRLPPVISNFKRLGLDNVTFMKDALKRYKMGLLNSRQPNRIETKVAEEHPNYPLQDLSTLPLNNPQPGSTNFNSPAANQEDQDDVNNVSNATLSSPSQQKVPMRDIKKLVFPFQPSFIEQKLRGLTVKDYEIAMWFGVALGAFLVLVVGGSIVLVRNVMPRRFKSIFERIPYGPVKDLALPVETASEYSPMWSPVTLTTARPDTFVAIRDTKYGDNM